MGARNRGPRPLSLEQQSELTPTLVALRDAERIWRRWAALETVRRTRDARWDRTITRMTEKERQAAHDRRQNVVNALPARILTQQLQARVGSFLSAYCNREPMGDPEMVTLILEELAGALVLLHIWETKRHEPDKSE